MALVPTQIRNYSDNREKIVDFTFDSSYPTGGEPITAALALCRNTIDFIIPGPVTTAGAISPTKSVVWDHVNSKLLLYTAAGTEAVNATDQSTVKVRCRVAGR